MHGKGKMVWSTGAIYDGNWERGMKKGAGVMQYRDKSFYDGQWKDESRHGMGIMRWRVAASSTNARICRCCAADRNVLLPGSPTGSAMAS